MATLDEVLKEMLSAGRFVPVNTGEVFLSEPEDGAGLNMVCIVGIPADAIVLRMDGTIASRLINSARGENRRADFVLIFTDQGRRFLVHAELKTSELSAGGPHLLEKFNGTDCILDYCERLMDTFYGHPDGFSGYERRYVLMYKSPSISKSPTRPAPTVPNNKPVNHMSLPVDNFNRAVADTKVPVRRLICP